MALLGTFILLLITCPFILKGARTWTDVWWDYLLCLRCSQPTQDLGICSWCTGLVAAHTARIAVCDPTAGGKSKLCFRYWQSPRDVLISVGTLAAREPGQGRAHTWGSFSFKDTISNWPHWAVMKYPLRLETSWTIWINKPWISSLRCPLLTELNLILLGRRLMGWRSLQKTALPLSLRHGICGHGFSDLCYLLCLAQVSWWGRTWYFFLNLQSKLGGFGLWFAQRWALAMETELWRGIVFPVEFDAVFNSCWGEDFEHGTSSDLWLCLWSFVLQTVADGWTKALESAQSLKESKL